MPSRARSTDRPALVTAPRLWGQTKNNTPRVSIYIFSLPSSAGGRARVHPAAFFRPSSTVLIYTGRFWMYNHLTEVLIGGAP